MTVLALSKTRVSPLSALSAVPDFLQIWVALGLDWRLIAIEMEAINHKVALDPILSEGKSWSNWKLKQRVSSQMTRYLFFKTCLRHS